MTTYTALHIQSVQIASLHKELAEWLTTVHKTKSIGITQGGFPAELYGDAFIVGEGYPNLLAIGSMPPNWLTVHYNSFYEMQDVASKISKTLSCLAIVVMAQSVSEAYLLSVHNNGKSLRKLYWVGEIGEWVAQEGAPLPFESNPLGHNIGTDENPFFVFDRESVIEYCKHLGLQLWDQVARPDSWTILKARQK